MENLPMYSRTGGYQVFQDANQLARRPVQPQASGRYEDHYRRGIAENSETEGNKIWVKLWKLAVPPKVRTFWWRVIHGFIPVREELHRRHIEKQG